MKPKIGMNADQLVEMVAELVDGGVNFIKEDEILANPASCPLRERIPKVPGPLPCRPARAPVS